MPNQSSNQTNPLTPERIMQYAWGYAVPLAIEAAVQHRVFDLIDAHGPMSVAQLGEKSGASPRGLRMLLNMLVSIELLAREGDRYKLTPESEAFLVTTKPSFQGGIFKHISAQLLPRWMRLTEIVRSGKPALAVNDEPEGGAFFQQFVEDIFPMSYRPAQVLADHLNVARADAPVKVLDIAAGSGVWGIALAQRSPQVRVTAVDWPRVIPVTRRVAQRFGLADRFTFVEGDIATADLGRGYHVATLGHILHSEGEPRSRELLRRVFAALAPGGTIAIAEFLANADRTGPPTAMIFAVNMLVNTSEGDTFTFAEIASWLREAGFADARQLESPGPSPLVLATKPR
jgi:precorrin-6B methylase 2